MKEHLASGEESFFQNSPEDNSVEQNWQFLRDLILDCMEKFVPKKKASGRQDLPWMTRTVKRLIRRKQRAYNKAKKSNKDRDWALFRKLRKKTQSALKTAHWNHLNTLFKEDGGSNKGLWRYLKSTRKDTCGVSTLVSDGRIASDAQDKADMLNNQFSSVFTREDRWNLPPKVKSSYPKMPRITVSSAGVLKLLSQLNARKASGADNIPAVFLKTCARELATMLAFIMQQSLTTRRIPSDWKKALVTPVFKKGDKSKPENYRPVSLTSICCKITEHIIVSQTMKHLDNHSILVDIQHGFRRRRSCESQLIITSHDLATILNRHSQADVAVLDFAKAFDKVPHHRLLQKLKQYNLDNDVIGWVESFLSCRNQRVVVDGFASKEAPVMSGVPQGTVLGPLLFLIFINDIAAETSSSIRLFADDCLLYREVRTHADCHLLQQDLDKLTQWSKTWGMQFNVKKCNIISITNATKHNISHQYLMDGEIVSPTDTTDYLGVRFNGKLRWNQHIDHISSAANRMLGFLWRNLYKCPQDLKEKAYKTMIRPKVEYCASIWDPHHTKYIDKLESVQRRAARFVTNQPHRRSEPVVSVTAMIQDLGWEPLSTRRLQSRLTSFYKVLNHHLEIPQSYHPVPAQDLQDTRGHDKRFQTYQPEIDAYKFSFFPRTVVDWNKLPAETVHAESIEAFKLRLCASRE